MKFAAIALASLTLFGSLQRYFMSYTNSSDIVVIGQHFYMELVERDMCRRHYQIGTRHICLVTKE